MPSNQQLLEGLYTLGYPVAMLARVDKNMSQGSFKTLLQTEGVNPADWDKVNKLVEYRAKDTTTKAALWAMLDIMGASPATKRKLQYEGGDSPDQMYRVLVSELGEERAGALIIKATNGNPPKGAVWNPYRGESPPKGVNVKHGAMGVVTSVVPKGMTAIEKPTPQVTVRPGQKPPSRNQRAGVPPRPGTSMRQPGPAPPPTDVPLGLDAGLDFGTDGGDGGPGDGGPGHIDTRPPWVQQGRDPTPEEFDAYVHEHFGAQSWFMDVPEIKEIIWNMSKEGLTDGAEAQRRVSKTEWFRNTQSSARSWWAHERADPATARQSIAEQTESFTTMANKRGLDIPPDRLQSLAEASLRFGWNQDQIDRALGREFKYDPKAVQQSGKVSEMKALASKYLVPLADETIQTWAQGLMGGQFSDAQFAEYLKGTAKSMFPQLVAAIDSGLTVEDYINPYKQIAAQRLEVPPESINFMDPKWRSALDQSDPKTGGKRVMTLTEWESHIKRDPSYGYDKTQQGVNEAAKLAEELARKFGQVA